jgi:hypothetical protein
MLKAKFNSDRVEMDLARPRRYLAVLPSNVRPNLFSGD